MMFRRLLSSLLLLLPFIASVHAQSSVPPPPPYVSPKLPTNICAAEGDSRTQNAINTSASGVYTNSGAPHWIMALTGGRVTFPAALNFGITGQTSTQVAARAASDAATAKAGGASCVLIYFPQINDRTSGVTLAQTEANIPLIQNAWLAQNIAVIWMTDSPQGDTTYTSNALTPGSTLADLMAANAFLVKQARSLSNVYVADTFFSEADTSSLANSVAGYATLGNKYDGKHEGPQGMYLKVKYGGVLGIFNQIYPARNVAAGGASDVYSAENIYGAANTNPGMIGAVGTITAGNGSAVAGPTGWNFRYYPSTSGAVSATGQMAPCADGYTCWSVTESGAAGSGTGERTSTYQDINVGTNGVAVGETIKLSCHIEVTATSGIISVEPTVYTNGGSTTLIGLGAGISATVPPLVGASYTQEYESPDPITIPTGTTSIRVSMDINHGVSLAVNDNVKMRQCAVRQATP